MNQNEIISMARDAGFEVHERKQQVRVGTDALLGNDSTDKLERFAALVAAKERESCAQECDKLAAGALADQSGSSEELTNVMLRLVARLGHAESAAAIRARGQKEGV